MGKIMKKFIICLVASLMLFGTTAFAKDLVADLSLDGDAVTVNVSIKGIDGVCSGGFNLIYDNSAFEVTDAKAGDLLSKAMAIVNPQYSENAVRVTWAGLEEILSNGTLLTVNFKKIGDTDNAEFNFEKVKFSDFDGEVIELDNIQNAKIEFGTSGSGGGGIYNPKLPTDKTEETSEEQKPIEWKNPFYDVKKADWFYKNIEFVVEKGLMQGISNTEFAPNTQLTRSMFVTVLYRAEGEPLIAGDTGMPFGDVKSGSWYEKAVLWANENNIVYGVSEKAFNPDGKISREQMIAILYRYAGYKGEDLSFRDEILDGYSDKDSVGKYAKDALSWALSNSIISGKTAKTVNPLDTATRAETASILKRFLDR